MASLLDLMMQPQAPSISGLLGMQRAEAGAAPAGPQGPAAPGPMNANLQQALRGLSQPPAPPAAPAQPEQPKQSNPFLARIFAGNPVEGLSPEQNKKLRQNALLTAGLTMLAQPQGSALQALAMGVLSARQSTADTAGKLLDEQTTQARIQRRAEVLGSGLGDLERYEELRRIATKEGDIEQVKVLNDVIKELRDSDAGGMEVVQVNGQTFLTDGRGNLFEPGTQRQVTDAVKPKQELPSDLEGILAVLDVDMEGMDPTQRAALFQVWENFREKSATKVNVGTEGKIVEGIDAIGMKRLDAAGADAEGASKMLATLDNVESLLAITPTGKMEPLTLPLRQLGAAFGIASETLGPQETLRALSNQMALMARQNMPGQVSDRDIQFLKEQVIQLQNTPDANRRIIEIARRVANAQARRAAEMENFIATNKTGVGLMQHMIEWDKSQRGQQEDEGPAGRFRQFGRT